MLKRINDPKAKDEKVVEALKAEAQKEKKPSSKKGNRATTPKRGSVPQPPSASELGGTELENLRDILYGNQSRVTETRLNDLESRLVSVHQELTSSISEQTNALRDTFTGQLDVLRKDLTERIEQQVAQQKNDLQVMQQNIDERNEQQCDVQNGELKSVQRQLEERVDRQNKEQTEQTRALQRTLTSKLDALTTESQTATRNVRKELSDRLDKMGTEQSERARKLETEARQRDDNIREELVSLTALLEGKKVSSHDLGLMLLELGHRLQNAE